MPPGTCVFSHVPANESKGEHQGFQWAPLEPISSPFINAKDERQEKREVMVVHKFLVRSAVPFGRVQAAVAWCVKNRSAGDRLMPRFPASSKTTHLRESAICSRRSNFGT
jgi:hypothetical protein